MTLIEVVLIREGRVGGIALFRLMTPIFSFTCALLLGLLFQGSLEMIVGGYLLGLAAIVLIGSAILIIPLMVAISVADVRELSQSYSRFLQYIGPGLLFHTAAYNLPSVVGLSFFGGSVVAAYNLAYKFVLAPMTIVGKAISQAYISNLSSAYRSDREFSFAKRVDMVLFGLALSAKKDFSLARSVISALSGGVRASGLRQQLSRGGWNIFRADSAAIRVALS